MGLVVKISPTPPLPEVPSTVVALTTRPVATSMMRRLMPMQACLAPINSSEAPRHSVSNWTTEPRMINSAPSISPLGATVSRRKRGSSARSCSSVISSRRSRSRTMKRLVLTRASVSITARPRPSRSPPLRIWKLKGLTAMRGLSPWAGSVRASSIPGPPSLLTTLAEVQPPRTNRTASRAIGRGMRFMVDSLAVHHGGFI